MIERTGKVRFQGCIRLVDQKERKLSSRWMILIIDHDDKMILVVIHHTSIGQNWSKDRARGRQLRLFLTNWS